MKALLTIAIISALSLSGCSDITNAVPSDEISAERNEILTKKGDKAGLPSIYDIAAKPGDFSILAAAVDFAGLKDALDGNRQLTVFAPTNAAFAKLLNDEIDTPEKLLNALGEETVKAILLYHVAPGNRGSQSVVNARQIRTLSKQFIAVKREGMNLQTGNNENGFANIIDTDVEASNGVIHVLDTVMLPPSDKKNMRAKPKRK